MTKTYNAQPGDAEPTTAKAARRVSVRRTSQEALNKRLESARTVEALKNQADTLAKQFEMIQQETNDNFLNDLARCRAEHHEKGVEAGKTIAMADYETQLDESICNRLCDNDRNLPWPVGVIMAGEQHRILQALAEYVGDGPLRERAGGGILSETDVVVNVQGFARYLGIIHFPEHLDAPSAVTYRNCEEPPKVVERDQKGKQIQLEQGETKLPGYTEHWKYYLRQLEDGTG